MKKQTRILLSILFITIFLATGFLFYSRYQDSEFLYCSAKVPRGRDIEKWQKITDLNLPIDKIDESYFNKFKISSDSEKYTIDFPPKQPAANPFAFEIREMSPGEALKIGSGTFKLSVIGINYPDANQGKDKDIDIRYYDGELQAMPEARINELENQNIIRFKQVSLSLGLQYPHATFIFEHENIENVMFGNFWIYDSRTHKQLTSGGGSSVRENSWEYQTNIPLWHKAPVDIVFDITFGPTETYEFPPDAGEGFKRENFECRLLDVFEGVNASISSSSELLKASPPASCQRFYFICQPQAIYMPVTFDVLDKYGNKLKTQGGSTSTYTHIFKLMEPLEKASLVRAEYRAKRYRILLHLPFIPGLPERNRDIDNLFDEYVPYAKFENAYNIQQFLQKILQFNNFQNSGMTPPDNIDRRSFPMEFRDVKVGEIAKVYSTGGRLDIDIKNDKLELKYPVSLKEKIKQFINIIMQKK